MLRMTSQGGKWFLIVGGGSPAPKINGFKLKLRADIHMSVCLWHANENETGKLETLDSRTPFCADPIPKTDQYGT